MKEIAIFLHWPAKRFAGTTLVRVAELADALA